MDVITINSNQKCYLFNSFSAKKIKQLSILLIVLLLSTYYSYSQTFNTTGAGSTVVITIPGNAEASGTYYLWSDPANWSTGTVPATPGGNLNNLQTVNIDHDIVYNMSDDLKVNNGAVINLNGASFTTPNVSGNGFGKSVFVYAGGTFNMCNAEFRLPIWDREDVVETSRADLSGNFESSGTVLIYDSSVDIAQNWSGKGGTREINGGCLRIGENFKNEGANDIYNNTCITLGWHNSGSFDASSGLIKVDDSDILFRGSGNFNVNIVVTGTQGACITGNLNNLDVSGNVAISDSGDPVCPTWNVTIDNYCIGGTVSDDTYAATCGTCIEDQFIDAQTAGTLDCSINSLECLDCANDECSLAIECSSNPATCDAVGAPLANASILVTTSNANATCGLNGAGITYTLCDDQGNPIGSPVVTTNETHTFTDLAPGTYTVKVEDAAGCEDECEIIIDDPDCNPCTPDATCNLQDISEEDCIVPDALTDPADVFSGIESCGATVTMTHQDVGDTTFCSDGDGVNFTRTYSLLFDGQVFTTCEQDIIITAPTLVLSDDCPGDPQLTGCATSNEIDTAWNTWIAGLQSITALGGCNATVEYSTPIDQLIKPNVCGDTQQVVSVFINAKDDCGETSPIECTFTVDPYVDTIQVSNCPGDPNLGGCATQEEIDAAWNTWIAAIQSMTANGSCGPITPDINPSIASLQKPTACNPSLQQITVNVSASDLCGQNGGVDCTFTVAPAAEKPTITTNDASRDQGCNPTITEPTFAVNDSCNPNASAIVTTDGQVEDGCNRSQTWKATYTNNCYTADLVEITYTWTVDDAAPLETSNLQDKDLGCNPSANEIVFDTPTFDGGCSDVVAASQIWINEFHYDNSGGDTGEFIEIAGTAGANLTGNSLILYNGSNGEKYNTIALTGIIPDEGSGFGALSFSATGLQNGAPDGIVLYDGTSVLEFISYEGDFTATNGEASGMSSTDVGIDEQPAPAAGNSLQRTGGASSSWSGPASESPGLLNTGQTISSVGDIVEDGCNRSQTKTWKVTDCSGLVTTITQTLNWIEDKTPPSLTIPANDLVECDAVPNVGRASATDNCDAQVNVEYLGERRENGDCEDSYTLIRTWTAKDSCGNSTTKSQVITVVDTTPPNLSIPIDTSAECNNIPDLGQVSATDNCDTQVDIEYLGEQKENGNCADNYFLIRIWRATDNCGNQTTKSQVITVIDRTPPELTIPADTRAECDEIPEGGPAFATDNCDSDVEITYDGERRINGDCEDAYTLIRTWTATDNCGNSSTKSQIITVEDTKPPSINTDAADKTVECDGQGNLQDLEDWLNSQGGALAKDNCSGVRWTNDFDQLDGDCTKSAKVTFTAWDDCGNSSTTSATFKIEDSKAPTLLDGAQIPVNDLDSDDCFLDKDQGPTEEEIAALFGDTCGNVKVKKTSYSKGTDCKWVAVYDYTIEDDCGNFAAPIQIVYQGRDLTPPTFDNPPPEKITVSCIDEIPQTYSLAWSDNCSSPNDPTVIGVDNTDHLGIACEGGYVLRTWTAVDDCGNETSVTQRINVDPAPRAQFDIPQDYTIRCNDLDRFEPQYLGYSNGIDGGACEISGSVQGKAEDFNEDCGEFKVIYEFTDECGRKITAIQTVTVVDVTPPELTIPADVRVECDQIPPPGRPTARDNCDNDVDLVYDGEQRENGDCRDNYTLIRTWTATDNCGNSTTKSQIITVNDTTPPELYIPADIRVECHEVPPPGRATATDNCDDDVDIQYDGERRADGDCDDNYTLYRTWTATDNCGNSTTLVQTIQVYDNTPPELTIPADIRVECDQIPPPGRPTARDNCDNEVDISYDGEQRRNGDCEDSYLLIRTWTATDNCGNSTTLSQTITVFDETPPELTVPKDETVECDSVPEPGIATATDNCDDDVDIVYKGEERIDGDCINNYVLIRTWTATDNCGNSVTESQKINVEDTTPPSVSSSIKEPIDLGCNIDLATIPDGQTHITKGNITGKDNCDGEVTLELAGNSRVTNGCENYLIYYYKAIDVCGNETKKENYATVTYYWEEDDITECQPTFAYNKDSSLCFTGDEQLNSDQFGWTNYFETPGEYTLRLYWDPGQCDPYNGQESIGIVKINYTGDQVTAEYSMNFGYAMNDISLYIGCEKFPANTNGEYTIDTNNYNFHLTDLGYINKYTIGPINVSSSRGIHVIASAISCFEKCRCTKSEHEDGVYVPIGDEAIVDCDKRRLNDNDLDLNNKLKFYPNPVEDILTISNPQGLELFNAEIFDITGRKVQSIDLKNIGSSIDLDLSKLPSAPYFITIKGKEGQMTKAIIKD